MKEHMTERMQILDELDIIMTLISAVEELTQQLVDLSCYPDRVDQFNAIDAARVATQEKLSLTVARLEAGIRYKRPIEHTKWDTPVPYQSKSITEVFQHT